MTKYFVQDGENYVPVEDTLLKQPDVDNIVEKRLERERAKFADYDSLKETANKVDSIKAEYEDKVKAIATEKSDLEKQLGSARLETEKVKIVNEFKLPDEWHDFVVGDNAEEMRARAEKLSKGNPGGTLKMDKSKKPDEKPSSSKALAGKLFGKSDD